RSYRDRHNRILLEGLRIVHDALLANMEPITIFYSNKNLIDKLTSKLPSRYFVPVDDKTMKNLLTALTPPGIVGVFKKPCSQLKIESNVLPLTVICDRVKDPSNLGTIVRTCAAAGCQALITTEYSTDLWDPKVLRGGAGGHFRVPLYGLLSWKQIADMLGDDTRLYLAESDNTGKIIISPWKYFVVENPISWHCYGTLNLDLGSIIIPYFEVDWTLGPSALIVGGETTGISTEAQMLACGERGQAVHIPMVGNIDSLSAGISVALIVYEAFRQI
ncbi:predicted protein, partial [Nematostella vectensis]